MPLLAAKDYLFEPQSPNIGVIEFQTGSAFVETFHLPTRRGRIV
jgi:hypothetical protein